MLRKFRRCDDACIAAGCMDRIDPYGDYEYVRSPVNVCRCAGNPPWCVEERNMKKERLLVVVCAVLCGASPVQVGDGFCADENNKQPAQINKHRVWKLEDCKLRGKQDKAVRPEAAHIHS